MGAPRCGRNSLSVELEEKYFQIAKDRIEKERGTLNNFANLSVEAFH